MPGVEDGIPVSSGPGPSPPRKRRALAGFAAFVLLAGMACVVICLPRRSHAAREVRAEGGDRLEATRSSEAEEEARAERAAKREGSSREEQALVEGRPRRAEQTRRGQQEKRRLAEGRARAGTGRRETERRLAADSQAKRETDQAAGRAEETGRAAAEAGEETRRVARATAEAGQETPQEETEEDAPDLQVGDTPDVDTEGTIDEVDAKRGWSSTGDLRPIYYYQDELGRDGSSASDQVLGGRVRLGIDWGLARTLRLGARLAGVCHTEDCELDFVMQGATPETYGLRGGQFTFDELYLHWFRAGRFDLAVGRLQTRFVLRGGVYAKSLDRNDSNNVNVTWTDGLHATYRTRKGWDAHLVLQRNTDEGTGSIRQGPLDFDDGGARITYFFGLENTEAWGPVVQRAFDVSYLPDSLLKDGDTGGRREDYWGVVGRLVTRWPRRSEGAGFRLGVEVGYAPETPTAAGSQLEDSGEADGLAWNVTASLMDFAPDHSIGLNYGRTGAGWLLSPQFRENEELLEVRYQWEPSRLPLLEARVRWREELERLAGAVRRRDGVDIYVRLTWEFTIRE